MRCLLAVALIATILGCRSETPPAQSSETPARPAPAPAATVAAPTAPEPLTPAPAADNTAGAPAAPAAPAQPTAPPAQRAEPAAPTPPPAADHTGHQHKAPHGGSLVELGEHLAHVEFLLDSKTGKLTAWVLDGCAEKAVRVSQKSIDVRVRLPNPPPAPATSRPAPPQVFVLTLSAVENSLTGETVGDSSEFTNSHPNLVNLRNFSGVIRRIQVFDQTLREVEFGYAEGRP